jgi:hypothetical protein
MSVSETERRERKRERKREREKERESKITEEGEWFEYFVKSSRQTLWFLCVFRCDLSIANLHFLRPKSVKKMSGKERGEKWKGERERVRKRERKRREEEEREKSTFVLDAVGP